MADEYINEQVLKKRKAAVVDSKRAYVPNSSRLRQEYEKKKKEDASGKFEAEMSRRPSIWVTYCSPEYRSFISSMQRGDYKNTPVCLTCWQYVTSYQRKWHEGFGHK